MMRMSCIFQRWVERWLRKWRNVSILIEVEDEEGIKALAKTERNHFRMKAHHHFRHIPLCSAG
ncbi:hypothetical protein DI43_16770 [Geobacillus sp. CAMR12739]|nr:hypothetical protein DI43_16770 [Geobacillus sp. CAMR12739]